VTPKSKSMTRMMFSCPPLKMAINRHWYPGQGLHWQYLCHAGDFFSKMTDTPTCCTTCRRRQLRPCQQHRAMMAFPMPCRCSVGLQRVGTMNRQKTTSLYQFF
jgi:hypothetical protein